MKPVKTLLITLLLCFQAASAKAASDFDKPWTPGPYVIDNPAKDAFCISAKGRSATIVVDPSDERGVARAARDLGTDIGRVSGVEAEVVLSDKSRKGQIVAGTIGSSRLIDKYIAEGKLDVGEILGTREAFVIQTVEGRLVIAGSDRRGTIYGIYDISENIGVSPWYWWADVPAKHASSIYVKAGRYLQPSPKVKYRGIFINDESPSFSGWSNLKFEDPDSRNGQNSLMYTHMFELLLRLKANYLWPAMWGKAFNEDDPRNPVLADEYGIIMGTSHHEPMMRAQQEYSDRQREVGIWDFVTNRDNLLTFWREGIDRNKNYDNLITVGMRGDGDVPMGQGDDAQNAKVLEQVIADQRALISEVYGKPASEVPQMWALFTEVQRYYDAGMTVPDDIMLMFCDNNWGYIRRTGPEKEKDRSGGMGLYYHIDMNGGPWNDRWINTTTIPKLREQLGLAYSTGIDDLWVINVGDLKPKEIPIDFIMRFAWNPDAIGSDRTYDYTLAWAEENFGSELAEDVAWIVSRYPKYNLMRKPEVQNTGIFSYANYDEARRQTALWLELEDRAEALKARVPAELFDAFYQLVYYPAVASSGVARMYLGASFNNVHALQGNFRANSEAEEVLSLFERDAHLSESYNYEIASGKWKYMMSDIHIGYTQWFMHRFNTLPTLYNLRPRRGAEMGVSISGSEKAWPEKEFELQAVDGTGLKREFVRKPQLDGKEPVLPPFDAVGRQTYRIEVFNRAFGKLDYELSASHACVLLDDNGKGDVLVSIDWDKAPQGKSEHFVQVRQKDASTCVTVKLTANNAPAPAASRPYWGCLEGEYSVDATRPAANVAGSDARWTLLPDLGRENGCMGISPVTAAFTGDFTDMPRLEYDILIPESGSKTICLGILPTQDVNPARGLRLAVSIDDAEPVILDARKGFVDTYSEYTEENLARSQVLKPLPARKNYSLTSYDRLFRDEVFDNLRWLDVDFDFSVSGIHTLKVWMVDPEIVLEKIIVGPDGRYSYSGPVPVEHLPR